MLKNAVATIFPEFSGKCRSSVILNEIAQKFICKICIIRNNNYTINSKLSYETKIYVPECPNEKKKTNCNIQHPNCDLWQFLHKCKYDLPITL